MNGQGRAGAGRQRGPDRTEVVPGAGPSVGEGSGASAPGELRRRAGGRRGWSVAPQSSVRGSELLRGTPRPARWSGGGRPQFPHAPTPGASPGAAAGAAGAGARRRGPAAGRPAGPRSAAAAPRPAARRVAAAAAPLSPAPGPVAAARGPEEPRVWRRCSGRGQPGRHHCRHRRHPRYRPRPLVLRPP